MNNQRSELAVILPDEWQVLTQQANALVGSGFLPQSIKNVQQAVAIMTLGRELGVGAWAALSSINVIQQKPTISPQLMLALINRSGQLEDMRVETSDAGCTVTMKRKGRTPHTETFDMQDAAAMQLTNKDNWRKQPATMLKWRAVAGCARVVFPDVILGLYTPEEMGANVVADDQGNMTIVEVKREDAPRNHAPQLVEGEVVSESQPSASVSGAGLPKNEPAELGPLGDDADDTPPNVYFCDRLRVQVNRTSTMFLLMTANGVNIVPQAADLVGLQVNGMFVEALGAGVYPLVPAWEVTAELEGNAWRVDDIKAGVAESSVPA